MRLLTKLKHCPAKLLPRLLEPVLSIRLSIETKKCETGGVVLCCIVVRSLHLPPCFWFFPQGALFTSRLPSIVALRPITTKQCLRETLRDKVCLTVVSLLECRLDWQEAKIIPQSVVGGGMLIWMVACCKTYLTERRRMIILSVYISLAQMPWVVESRQKDKQIRVH